MKYLRIIILVIGLALLPSTPFLLSSCTAPTAGTPTGAQAPNESVVVNAEKTLRVSKDTFDIFLKLEKQNQALVKSKWPQIHSFAETLRRNAPDWLITANNLKNDYKHGTGTLAALTAALDVIITNATTANNYISQINHQ